MQSLFKPKGRKGIAALSQLPSGVLMFAVAFIILGFVAVLLQSLQSTQTNGSTAQGILNNSLAGADAIGDQGANIGLVIVIVIIIGLLIGGFGYLMAKKR